MSRKVTRDHNVRFLVSKSEKKMLKALANNKGTSVSDYLRLTIREEHAKLKEASA